MIDASALKVPGKSWLHALIAEVGDGAASQLHLIQRLDKAAGN